MIEDKQVQSAISTIIQRSERQSDIEKVLESYFDVGFLTALKNKNNQIFFGRRGTGKTHVLRVLEHEIKQQDSTAVCYVDCRSLGSSAQFTDVEVELRTRCTALFRDILTSVYEVLEATVIERCNAPNAFDALEVFERSCFEIKKIEIPTTHTTKSTESNVINSGANVRAMPPYLELDASSSANTVVETTKAIQYRSSDKIIFPDIARSLKEVLTSAKVELHLLIDEWSSLPEELQPYLAEFFKRSLFPISSVVIKIAALEHRCRFVEHFPSGGAIGVEIGADISTSLDLDDYFVYDRSPEESTSIFENILYRHLASSLGEEYLRNTHGVSSETTMTRKLFSERSVLIELARASEGVVRDFINIFNKSFFKSMKNKSSKITKKAVVDSSMEWFQQDKQQSVEQHLQVVLGKIVEDVIGSKKARSFLVPMELTRHKVIQKLFDARVLHLVKRGYADKDRPGVRYDIYTLDYGTYVNLISTSKAPDGDFTEEIQDDEFVVPFDDARRIRRIIMKRDILEVKAQETDSTPPAPTPSS